MKITLAHIFVFLVCAGAIAHFSATDVESRSDGGEKKNGDSRNREAVLPSTSPAISSSPNPITKAEPRAPRPHSPTSKRAEVLALACSDSPEDKFAAYKAAEACVAAREKYVPNRGEDPNGPVQLSLNSNAMKEPLLCGDLSTTEILQRLQWLEAAASAGVRGAAQAFINGGPDGRGYSGNGDPIWESKIPGFLEVGAKNRDVYALLMLSDRYESGPKGGQDLLVSLAYYELAMEASLEQRGKPLPHEDVVVKRLRAALTQEQLAKLNTVKDTLLNKRP